MYRLFIAVALLLGAVVVSRPIEAAEQPPESAALLVGINDYKSSTIGNLAEPENDVERLAKVLDRRERRRFSTEVLLGSRNTASRAQILSGWERTLRRASAGKGQRAALFYFAGHAIERAGRNYLLPGGLRSRPEADVEPAGIEPVAVRTPQQSALDDLLHEAVPLADLIAIAAKYQHLDLASVDEARDELLIIIIIDACRDDPFPQLADPNTTTAEKGLGSFNLNTKNVFVMYSAGIGQVAADQSAFAHAVAAEINNDLIVSQSPVSLNRFAQDVRRIVVRKAMAQTGRQQLPAFYDQTDQPRTVSGARTEPQRIIAAGGKIDVDEAKLTHLDTFIECDGCPEMVLIERGRFTIGSPASEEGRVAAFEQQAVVAPENSSFFAIGKTEVTNAQWLQCARDTDAEHRCGDLSVALKPFELQRPVTGVTHDDAKTFAAWLSQKTGQIYRLPTEAEWEYAARGGNGGAYSFTDGRSQSDRAAICDYANGADESVGLLSYSYKHCSDKAGRHASAVQSYRANGYGLHDMHGNAWEWVADCWFDTYDQPPITWRARDPAEASSCGYRVARGGSWRTGLSGLRSANRNRFPPGESRATLGFRVARSIEPMRARVELAAADPGSTLTPADTLCPDSGTTEPGTTENGTNEGECFFAERYPEELVETVVGWRLMLEEARGRETVRGLANASFLWPVHPAPGKKHIETINICFLNGNNETKAATQKHITEWLTKVAARGGRVPVTFLGTCDSTRRDQHIRISFLGDGSHSAVGWQSMTPTFATRPSMVIGVKLADNWRRFKRVVVHEFGHALGLEHEHQHPGINCWETGYKRDELLRFMKDNGWTESSAISQLRVLSGPGYLTTTYDAKSVMLYSFPERYYVAGSKCYYDTHSNISDGDAKLVADLYPNDRTTSASVRSAVDLNAETLRRRGDVRKFRDVKSPLEQLFDVREGLIAQDQ